MSNHPRKYFEDDVLTWIFVAVIFVAVNLALWGTLLWESIYG
jgi:ABC-type Mn2+/Zn2+ transport system permease subunit